MDSFQAKVGARYSLTRPLGNGSFGQIYFGLDDQTQEEVAIKLEPANAPQPQLFYEAKILKTLQNNEGFSTIRASGSQDGYNYMVVDLLGPNLEDLFRHCGNKFSLKTTTLLAIQLITRIQGLHKQGYIHRDIKPENLVIGMERKSGILYLIDFGLAKRYRDAKTLQHMRFRDGKSFIGTQRYGSLNSHLGREQSRRDDLEGIAYTLIYLLKGTLPWQGVKAQSKAKKSSLVKKIKASVKSEDLCQGLPEQFKSLVDYTKKLKFDEEPDYDRLKGLFQDVLSNNGWTMDYDYDWNELGKKTKESQFEGGSSKKEENGSLENHKGTSDHSEEEAQSGAHSLLVSQSERLSNINLF